MLLSPLAKAMVLKSTKDCHRKLRWEHRIRPFHYLYLAIMINNTITLSADLLLFGAQDYARKYLQWMKFWGMWGRNQPKEDDNSCRISKTPRRAFWKIICLFIHIVTRWKRLYQLKNWSLSRREPLRLCHIFWSGWLQARRRKAAKSFWSKGEAFYGNFY
jgi:hypothetical protein